ncbi:MAG: hypothetical protein HUU57_14170 [Bdellovibrio sp.]|nr:hypothetical protein [Bdellovibrio sp.]
MKKLMIALLMVAGQFAYAGPGDVGSVKVKFAPIKGSCQVGQDVISLDFPTGNGSLFPVFRNGIALSVFAGPSEGLLSDDKGVNLFDVNISAISRTQEHLGTTIVRNLTANPKYPREIAIDLYDGTIMNCKF